MKNGIFLFIIISLLSCQREMQSPVTATLPEQTKLNVAYGPDSLQKMDIYLPAGRTTGSTRVIILIHGGGWTQEDKSGFSPYVDTLKKRFGNDYAIVNINYRLAANGSNLFPTQENDVKAAVEYIYSKRSEYIISDKFVLLGASAGGHMALLQAYKNPLPVKIKAVIDFFGPTDLVEMYNNPIHPLIPFLLREVTGGTPLTHATLYVQSSPINFASAQSPPTMILQGGVDMVVAPSQSVLLKNKLQTLGVTHQYVFYPTENHGWFGANLTDSFDKIVLFLAANVN
jgi:dipeptidyl aminopeptidase/acylaminoacyl peptidase